VYSSAAPVKGLEVFALAALQLFLKWFPWWTSTLVPDGHRSIFLPTRPIQISSKLLAPVWRIAGRWGWLCSRKSPLWNGEPLHFTQSHAVIGAAEACRGHAEEDLNRCSKQARKLGPQYK